MIWLLYRSWICFDSFTDFGCEISRLFARETIPGLEDLSIGIQQKGEREFSLGIVFIRHGIIQGLLLLAQLIFLAPREIGVDKHKAAVCHLQEIGVIKYLLAQHDTRAAPVTSREIEQDMFVLLFGKLSGFDQIIMPAI